MTYTYAIFDQYGHCKNVMRSNVPLNLPYSVENGTKPEDIYYDGESVAERRRITLTVNRDYFINDGIDGPIIIGLPSDGRLMVNNIVDGSTTSDISGAMMIEAVGKYRSNPICVVFEPLEQIAARFIKQVDREAGVARARYMTSIPGQQFIYAKKEAEARAYLNSEPGDYPFLTAEAGRGSMNDLAHAILARARATETALASIEVLRIGAKQAISTATDAATILAAADITWP